MIYKAPEAVIKLFNDTSLIASEAKYKAIHGKGRPAILALRLKILTPKQMLQRLQTALVQVKAGNTSENILNEICQIKYSLHQAKEITKTVYNNIKV